MILFFNFKHSIVELMSLSYQIAKHFREVYFGGNWTTSNLKEILQDITWQQATTVIGSFNTLATLTYHMSYYVVAMRQVLEGKPLESKDAYSFDHPTIESEKDWQEMVNQIWKDVEDCASLIEQLPDNVMWENFTDEKYGIYYRNISGIIEHSHYHLGQIAMLKKWLNER
jgi:hypothetical protein